MGAVSKGGQEHPAVVAKTPNKLLKPPLEPDADDDQAPSKATENSRRPQLVSSSATLVLDRRH